MDKIINDRYKILELAGSGGMAHVYKALDLKEQKIVALKILKKEYMQNKDFVRRFQNESKAIALLSHTNIVRVYNVMFDSDIKVIVMEYVNGITLKDYIKQQEVLSYKEAVYFTVQILKALQHAHDKGIVHRDVKPHNVMLLSDGTIKVMDFGIARFARSETVTISDKTIGSVHYISPEQARGGSVDGKTDIYSVGVMMFEMLTGKLPFEADSPVSVALKQIQDVPEKPRDINQDIPLGLEAITIRAMQKDVNKRYQSAAEMLKDIDEFRKNPDITFNYKYDRPERMGKILKRNNEDKKEEVEIIDRSPVLAILAGVTTSVVITALVFLGYIFVFNNPFGPIEDIDVPDFVGLKYELVEANKGNDIFMFEIIEEPNAEYEAGFIFEQDPIAERKIKPSIQTITLKVSTGQKSITMLDFVNQRSDSVYSELTSMGLEYTEVLWEDEEISPGYVIKTSPEKDAEIVVGTNVTVYVSSGDGKKTVDVPKVVDMNIDQAKKVLLELGLIPGDVEIVPSDKPENQVIEQAIASGTPLEQGSRINLKISGGIKEKEGITVTVPMPNMQHNATIEAIVAGEVVETTNFKPADVPSWTIRVNGEALKTLAIKIDGELYMEYVVDFENNEHRLITDNSAIFMNSNEDRW